MDPASIQATALCLPGDYPGCVRLTGKVAAAKSHAKSLVSSRIFKLTPKMFSHREVWIVAHIIMAQCMFWHFKIKLLHCSDKYGAHYKK